MQLSPLIFSLPDAVQTSLLCFIRRPWVEEMKANVSTCFMCQRAFHKKSLEYVNCLLASFTAGNDEDDDSDFTMRPLDTKCYVCSSCAYKQSDWVCRESAAFEAVRYSSAETVTSFLRFALPLRPPAVDAYLKNEGFPNPRAIVFSFRWHECKCEHCERTGKLSHCMPGAFPLSHWQQEPPVKMKRPAFSLWRAVYMFGYDPRQWPTWLMPQFGDLIQFAQTAKSNNILEWPPAHFTPGTAKEVETIKVMRRASDECAWPAWKKAKRA